MIVEEHCNRFYTVQKLLSCNILSFCVVWLGLSFINASGHCFAGNTGRQNEPIFRLVRMPTLPKLGKALLVWLEKEKDFQLPLGLFYPVALESTGRGRNERDEVGKESNTNQPFYCQFYRVDSFREARWFCCGYERSPTLRWWAHSTRSLPHKTMDQKHKKLKTFHHWIPVVLPLIFLFWCYNYTVLFPFLSEKWGAVKRSSDETATATGVSLKDIGFKG